MNSLRLLKQSAKITVATLRGDTFAMKNHIIKCMEFNAKGGKAAKKKGALTNQQAEVLLEAVKGLPPFGLCDCRQSR